MKNQIPEEEINAKRRFVPNLEKTLRNDLNNSSIHIGLFKNSQSDLKTLKFYFIHQNEKHEFDIQCELNYSEGEIKNEEIRESLIKKYQSIIS